MSAWKLENISHRFRNRWWQRRAPQLALDGVDLEVQPGERVAIIGESGAGKTTLARIGLGLLRPENGNVHLFGENTAGWTDSRWRSARKSAQLLFQDPRSMLNPAMRIGALLEESAALHRTGSARQHAAAVLESVGLDGRENALPHHLSGGEQRRVGIARLLLAQPRLVVADEPTAGLDAALKASLLTLLLERVGPDCAVVLISHDLPLVAWACHRWVVMRDARVVDRFQPDAPGERHPYTQQLMRAAGLSGASP